MLVNVEILNIIKYKKDDKEKTRISYRLLDKESVSNSDKFKGYSELSVYLDNTIVFDTLGTNHCGIALKFKFEEVANSFDPMKKKVVLKEILHNDKSICLL